MSAKKSAYWTHPSVLALAKGADPFQFIVSKSRALVLAAMEEGWSGPPFDPFILAEQLNIATTARDDIRDARTIPAGSRFRIEYNPNRPPARVRFSIAHEIAHTLFPDCKKRVRNREAREHMSGDDWQLEMLCNVAASELLMPVGSFGELSAQITSIDDVLRLRNDYQVSSEALLLRIGHLAEAACMIFGASRTETDGHFGPYRLDYVVFPTDWTYPVASGLQLPGNSIAQDCTAIGYTAKGDEEWAHGEGLIHIECIGVAPYPAHTYPRVVGIATPKKRTSEKRRGVTVVNRSYSPVCVV